MDLVGISQDSYGSIDEIEKLYEELYGCECNCSKRRLLDSCDFHEKLTKLKDLQDREIEFLQLSFSKLQLHIAKTMPLLEEIDAGLDDVLK